ncbi:MAG: PEP-CTERM sorting domain-containing protein [Luteolibacter sp.]
MKLHQSGLLAIVPFLGLTSHAYAADGTWIGGNNNGNWSTAASWNNNVIGDGVGSVVNITANYSGTGGSAKTVTINTTSRTVGILNFGDTTGDNGKVSLVSSGGTTLTFNNSGAGAQFNNIGGFNNGGALTILLADNLSFKNSSATLFVMTDITAASGNRTLTNEGVGAGQLRLSVAGNGSGTLSLTQNSSTSDLEIFGSSTYTGQTTVTLGRMFLNAAGGNLISNSSALLVNGGNFDLNGNNETVGAVTISSGSISGTANTLTGSSYALQGGNVNAKLGTGAITVSSGTTTLGSAGRLNTASSLAVNSGQLTLGGAESVASYTQTGGTLGAPASVNTLTSAAAYDMQAGTVNAKLGGSVGLNKTTGGTTTLNGTNTYMGVTNISGGTLALGSTGSIANTSSVNLAGGILDVSAGGLTLGSAQSLTGSGTVTGNLTIDGNLAIGNSPGTINFNDSLSLTASSVSTFEFASALFGAGTYDLANGTGDTVTFGGILNLVFNGTETYNTGDSVTIFSNFGTYSGAFDTVNFSGLGAGQAATFDASNGLVSITAVPEPSAFALLIGGIGVLAFRRRRA